MGFVDFNITIDGITYNNSVQVSNSEKDSSYVKSMAFSSNIRNTFQKMPENIESGAEIKSDDPAINWIPFSYLFWAYGSRRNIYDEIASGNITKDGNGKDGYPESEWKYIQDHYDEYVAVNRKNGKMPTEEPKPVEPTHVGAIPPTLPLAASASIAPLANPSSQPTTQAPVQQPLLSRAPVDSNPMRAGNGYDRTPDGGYRMNMSQVVQPQQEMTVDLTAQMLTQEVPSQSPTYVEIPTPAQIATEQPNMVDVQPPKTQKSKKDLKEGAVHPTIIDNNDIDATEKLVQVYPVLDEIRKIICGDANTFNVAFTQDHGLVTVTTTDKDDPSKVINECCMVVDPIGQIHTDKQVKFWPIPQDNTPVDFVAPIAMSTTNLESFINGAITDDMYCYSDKEAELNRTIVMRSVTDKIKDKEELEKFIDRLSDIFAKPDFINKCAGRRFKLTDYTDIDNFEIVSDNSVVENVTASKSSKAKKPITVAIKTGTGTITVGNTK